MVAKSFKSAVLRTGVVAVLVGAAAFAKTLLSAPTTTAATEATPTVAGWSEFVDGLRDLPDRMLAKLPEEQRRDPQIQQEIGRLALEALASSAIDALGSDGDHPAFVAQINQTLNVGQPNADTGYRVARITPGGTYRLRGTRGSLRMVRIAESGPSPYEPGFVPPTPGKMRTSHDINTLHTDAHGQFTVILSPVKPAGYQGDWWPLEPDTTRLLMRLVNANWGHETEPSLSIERLDKPVERPRPTAAALEANLRRLPASTAFIALLFVDHVERLHREGFVNKLKVFDTAQLGGLAGQFYYEGAYELRDDEALVVETSIPAKCLYHSIILTNDLYETTDWYNNHSSLNDSQTKPDKDGVLRIVVSARDPGVPNWLDTAGYPSGVIQGRWAECDSQPIPNVRKVSMADLPKILPSDTPKISRDQREQIIRERRAALQQRPLW
jgi:hypothetical protein